mmetsp:Transcript_14320/g.47034  ORF Transcript_14320/g.47034 Transcript_14320/m.47034 type:complete len:367 (+) Transcript_14320:1431-2531(+)
MSNFAASQEGGVEGVVFDEAIERPLARVARAPRRVSPAVKVIVGREGRPKQRLDRLPHLLARSLDGGFEAIDVPRLRAREPAVKVRLVSRDVRHPLVVVARDGADALAEPRELREDSDAEGGELAVAHACGGGSRADRARRAPLAQRRVLPHVPVHLAREVLHRLERLREHPFRVGVPRAVLLRRALQLLLEVADLLQLPNLAVRLALLHDARALALLGAEALLGARELLCLARAPHKVEAQEEVAAHLEWNVRCVSPPEVPHQLVRPRRHPQLALLLRKHLTGRRRFGVHSRERSQLGRGDGGDGSARGGNLAGSRGVGRAVRVLKLDREVLEPRPARVRQDPEQPRVVVVDARHILARLFVREL